MPPASGAIPASTCKRRHPQPRLADPGIGLRDNGRRVLTYADLRSLFADPDGREPERTIELHLTGHMERFMWSFDGIPFASAEPLELRYGERVRIRLVNDTMMSHPIHLHGMWSDLEDEAGALSRAQAHDQHAARHAALVPRHGRRARPLGVSLPSALPHGSRHVPRGARRCVAPSRAACALALGGWLASAAAQPAHDEHAADTPSTAAARSRSSTRRARGRARAPRSPICGDMSIHDTMLENPLNKLVVLDRLEAQDAADGDVLHWDLDTWVGRDLGKLWIRSEGERRAGDTERADLELLWGNGFARWWELVAGARADFAPGADQEWAAVGVRGLAPYRRRASRRRRTSADGGRTALRVDTRYELLVTNRLILEPSLELDWHGEADPERGLGSGLTDGGARPAPALRDPARGRAVRRSGARAQLRRHRRLRSRRGARSRRHAARRRHSRLVLTARTLSQ